MERKTIILIFSIALIGLFLSDINEITGEARRSFRITPISCEDTDEGIDYSTQGTVTYEYSWFGKTRTRPYTDRCRRNTLYEYYCEGNKLKTKRYTCPEGCDAAKGVCKEEAKVPKGKVPKAKCKDSDGLNLGIKGVTSGIEWGTSNKVTKRDYCITSGGKAGRLAEFYCANNQVASVTFDCPLYHKCVKGACKKETSKEAPATAVAPPAIPTCIDTDGGKDYYLKGTVSAPDEAGTDECCTSTGPGGYACPGDGNILHEWYCDPNTLGEDEFYECPKGCKDGACLKEEPTCTETDEGKEPYLKGTTTAPPQSPATDTCAVRYETAAGQTFRRAMLRCSGSSCYVVEYYCDEGVRKSEYIYAPSRVECYNGAFAYTCEVLKKNSETNQFFGFCADGGYDNVCFNKYTGGRVGAGLGCTKDAYNDCTANNIDADKNILCDLGT